MVSMEPEKRNLSVYGAMDPQTESGVAQVIKTSNPTRSTAHASRANH